MYPQVTQAVIKSLLIVFQGIGKYKSNHLY